MDLRQWAICVTLVAENTLIVFLMKRQVLSLSPLLFMMAAEATKLLLSLLCFIIFDFSSQGARMGSGCHVMVFPALCFLMMNALSFYSLRFITSSMFATLAELKLVFTAVFHSLLFGAAPLHKLAGLAMIFSGGMMILLQEKDTFLQDSPSQSSMLSGVCAAVGVQVLSAAAAIFQEKVLKAKNTSETLWLRNLQLSSISLLLNVLLFLLSPNPPSLRLYLSWTLPDIILLLLVSFSSLTASLCAKYLTSVIKCILTSMSFGFSIYVSSIAFGTPFTAMTLVSILVIGAGVVTYSFKLNLDWPSGYQAKWKDEQGV